MIIHQLVSVLSAIPPILILSPAPFGVTGVVLDAPCFAGVQYKPDGSELAAQDASSSFVISRGNWLNKGDSNSVYIQWTRTGGTLADWNSTDSGDARVQMNINRQWRIIRSILGVDTITGKFDFWNDATGGSLIATTGIITFTAERDI